MLNNAGCNTLRFAILQQAVKDYMCARKRRDEHMQRECERFFFSDWFLALCDIDGATVKEMLDKRFEKQQEKKRNRTKAS